MKNNLEVVTAASFPLAIFCFAMWRSYKDPADPLVGGVWFGLCIIWVLLLVLCIAERVEKL